MNKEANEIKMAAFLDEIEKLGGAEKLLKSVKKMYTKGKKTVKEQAGLFSKGYKNPGYAAPKGGKGAAQKAGETAKKGVKYMKANPKTTAGVGAGVVGTGIAAKALTSDDK